MAACQAAGSRAFPIRRPAGDRDKEVPSRRERRAAAAQLSCQFSPDHAEKLVTIHSACDVAQCRVGDAARFLVKPCGLVRHGVVVVVARDVRDRVRHVGYG